MLKHVAGAVLPDLVLRRLREAYYPRLIRRVHEESEPDLHYLRYLLRSGDTVLDIGANTGSYTKILSRCVGPGGHVLSLEPIPETFDVLLAVVRALRLDNVRPLRYAVSDADGVVTMEIPLWNSRAENFYLARVREPSASPAGRCLAVAARSIDSIVMDLPAPPVFIKIDVEGHEWPCIKGARRTLERDHPAWLMEVADPDEPASAGASLFALLREHGYGAWRSAGTGLVPRQPGEQSINYWFLRSEHLARLKDAGLDAQTRSADIS